MRTATVVVLSLLAALVVVTAVPHSEPDKEFLEKQRKLIRLFYHVQQPTIIKEEQEIAKSYKPIEHLDNYQYKDKVEVFWKYYVDYGFLPRGEVFSIYYEKNFYQAKALFELFYYAKDFDTFYKTAVWAKEHLNQGLFVYSYTVAVLHREDTKYVTLPAPYEIYPQLFVNAEVIQKAYDARLRDVESSRKEPYIFYANYSGFPVANNPEELVSYFTEDVGLNSFFAYLHYKSPFWLNPSNYSIPVFKHRGAGFFFLLQQLLARYYLERLSNNLPDVKPIDYTRPVQTGYYPELRLQNGIEAPVRPEGVYPYNFDSLYVERIQNYERRIRDAIDFGYAYGCSQHDFEKFNLREKDVTDIIGNIIEGNAESVNYEFYGSIYRYIISLFGHIADPFHKYGTPASVLEQPETQLRDPVYYRIAKRILSFFYQYKNKLPPYTRSDLELPGVAIESISFDKLVTYFDNFDIELNNALSFSKPEEGDKFNFVARQYRLNHKPFYYQLKVKSDKEIDSVVRVFIGPKYDAYGRELTLEERRPYYFLLDEFNQKLSAGENEIRRSSKEFPLFAKEAPRHSDLYYSTVGAIKGENKFFLDEFRSHFGFPQRLALPRGTRSGLPLSVFAIVTPAVQGSEHPFLPFGDNQAGGFPFDRRVVAYEFDVPNVYSSETFVVHRRLEDISSTV
ncbi:hexamerin-like [Schistocerca americana]|uniref:hexamerin-like n=1 Tax=Schistocerca americana TaxID=7009 RepID=UPI001F5003AC|nr:hexamerin-like [Schistocerca americana]XP_049948621.1 hexamerin-like isoform X1 [Schistocerca serialis cubense]